LLRRLSNSADHLVRERSPERRSDLRYLACWSQSSLASNEACSVVGIANGAVGPATE
jgi:hypothetical protein